MSIGEDLAQARRRAGLTVTQVSQQTRIREAIIRAIERDDYCACGGDFYARGHIGAIAHAIGADPRPLIAAYDAAHQPPQPVTAAKAFRPATPARPYERRRPSWVVALGLTLVIILGIVAYHVLSGSRHAPGATRGAAAGLHRPPGRHPGPATPPPATAPVPDPYAHEIAIRLTAVQDCWVEFTTPAGVYLFQSYIVAGRTKRWTFRHAVEMQLGNPGGIRLTVDGKNPLPPGTAQPITLRLGLHGKISG